MSRIRIFSDKLANALAKAETLVADVDGSKSHFTPKTFFDEWFREQGSCYFFLFKKNLKVTNIQFAELLALMRSHFNAEGSDPPADIQFITSTDFNASVERLFDSFPAASDSFESRCRKFGHIYAPLFRRLIVVDGFFGSCAVFVPPCLSLNLERICAYSGYVHSCGHNVFTRKAYKTQKQEFFAAIRRYLKRQSADRKNKKVFFAAYSHEDFTKYDRRWADELLDGLDNVKIFVEKYYMGPDSLVSVLREMKEAFEDELVIPEAGNFKEKHESLHKNSAIDASQTLWLLVDRSATGQARQPGEIKYFICYAQVYKNENPFHYFDENKPAWVSHTTIPHTLMGAMINITKPWPTNANISLADPFVGTGTTWLEMLKYPEVRCHCRDLDPLTPLLVKDNLEFFSAAANELGAHIAALEFVLQPSMEDLLNSPDSAQGKGNAYLASYRWALENLDDIPRAQDGADSARLARAVRDLGQRSLQDRLFLYLALRTSVRHNLALERLPANRRSEEWPVTYRAEALKLLEEFKALQELRGEEADQPSTDQAVAGLAGSYSQSCTINRLWLRKTLAKLKEKNVVKSRDARKLPRESFDIVVTDPPYGFNEGGNDQRELAAFYASIMETLVLALKKEGHLVFAVPDWSHTGKRLPFFTYQQVITQQVLVAAEKHNRQVFRPSSSVPAPSNLFRAPFYWESERALRRAILHFRLRSVSSHENRRKVSGHPIARGSGSFGGL